MADFSKVTYCPPCPPPSVPPDPSYPCPTRCTIITCSLPPPSTKRAQFSCEACFPSVEPIKAIRFAPAACPPHGIGPWTNLTYHPIIQGGIKYYGVYKLIPLGPPPGSPVLCRYAPVKPSDSPGITTYSSS